MKAEEVEQRVRELLPAGLHAFPFKIDMAQQDPRPLNPIGMQDRQIYVYDAASRTVSAEPLKELLKYLPGQGRPVPDLRHEPRARSAARRRPRAGPRRGPARRIPPTSNPARAKDRRHGKVPRRGLLRHRRAPDRRAAHDARRGPRLGGGRVPPHREPAPPRRHLPDASSRRTSASWGSSAPPSRATAAPGLDNVAYGLIMQELERGDSGLRSFASVQSALVMYPIYTYGSDAQKERWLPAPAARRGHRLLRPHRARLRLQSRRHAHARASKTATSYVLNGTKLWITNGSIADVAVVWAKVDDGEHPRLPRREGHARASRTPTSTASSRCARRSPRELAFDGLPRPAREHAARREGPQGPALVPHPGALRHRAGAPSAPPWRCYDGRSEYAQQRVAVQQADRRLPARAAEAGRDDHRDHQGPAPVPAARPAQGRRARLRPQQVSMAKTQQRADGARHRARWPATSSAPTASSTSTRSSATCESRDGLHLRGHPRHPHADRRPGHHRPRRVRYRVALSTPRPLPVGGSGAWCSIGHHEPRPVRPRRGPAVRRVPAGGARPPRYAPARATGPRAHGHRHQSGLAARDPAGAEGRAQSVLRRDRSDRAHRERHLVADPAALRLLRGQDGPALAAAAVGAALLARARLPRLRALLRRGAGPGDDHRLRGGRVSPGRLSHRHRGGGRPQDHRRLDLLHRRQRGHRAGPAAAHRAPHRLRPRGQPGHARARPAGGGPAHRGAPAPLRAGARRAPEPAPTRRAPAPWWAR